MTYADYADDLALLENIFARAESVQCRGIIIS